VLNTCTVTAGADKDARASIRRLQRVNPDCRILVTGCYAQRAPEELAALPGVTWGWGNSHKHQAAEMRLLLLFPLLVHPRVPVSSRSRNFSPGRLSNDQLSGDQCSNVIVGDIFAHTELLAAPVFEAANERTRPEPEVQDGCDNRCSFLRDSVCSWTESLAAERAASSRKCQTLVEAGYREVVISGINLGRWGRDLEGSSQLSAVSSQLKPTIDDRRLEVSNSLHSGADVS